ncbi:MAG: hypothetical protein Q9213_008230, partial [Squamulea squamosa]
MADRFPSLEEFGDGPTEPKSNGATNGASADDDFLTRERAILGDDANLFSTSNDNTATIQDGDDDLLGGGDSYGGGQGGGEEISDFESSFPAVDTRNEQMGPGGTITGSNLPYQPRQPQSYSGYQEPEEEPEPVR